MKRILAHASEITGDASLWRVVLILAVPAVGSMYLTWGFNFVDTAFAGRLGEVALAGLSTGAFVMWAIFGFANLVAVGTGAIVSRRIGEGHVADAERVAYQSVIMAVIVSAAYGVFAWFAAPSIFTDVMRVSEDVHAAGWAYLRIMLLGSPFMFGYLLCAHIFFAAGDTVRPLLLMVLALALTVLFDWVFMFGKFGAPTMGTAGAGLAVFVSRLAYTAVALYILASPRWPSFVVRPHGSWKPDWRLFGRIAYIGLPQAAEGVLFPVIYMLLTRYTTLHGTENVAALRIGHTAEGLVFFAGLGMGMTVRPLVGQNLGAGKPERAARAGWIGWSLLAIPVALYAAAMIAFPEAVARIFTDDALVIAAASRYLGIVGWSQIFMAAELVFVGAFGGAGYTWIPMAIVIPLTLARWPIAHFLEPLIGVDAVWWAISGTSIVKGILLAAWFAVGTWTRKRV